MKIAIDGIFMQSSQPGGYRTYTTNLVGALAEACRGHEFDLLVGQPTALQLPPNWHIHSLPRAGSAGFIWREQITLPGFLRAQGADLVHFPCATGGLRSQVPAVVTILDTIEFTDPMPSLQQTKRWGMRLYSRWVQRAVASKAQRVVTISDYSKRQIVRQLGLPDERVLVTHLAPSKQYRAIDRQLAATRVLDVYGISAYVLGIASVAPHKNTTGLLRAYGRLSATLRKRHPLMLVCTQPEARRMVQTQCSGLGLDHQVRLVDSVSDVELMYLYNAAAVFVYSSLDEGFGLPPLEAMACGTPVIASDAGSIPEVLGNAACLTPRGDTCEMAEAMGALLTNSALSAEMVERGFARSRLFSWEQTARGTVAAYETAVGDPR